MWLALPGFPRNGDYCLADITAAIFENQQETPNVGHSVNHRLFS